MASPINLLPTELTPSGSSAKLARSLNNLVFLGFTIFILVVTGAVSLFVINYFSIQSSESRQSTLSTSIKSMEATETRLILVKDRIKIAKNIMAKDSVSPDIAKLSGLLSNLYGTISLTEAEVSPNKTQFSVLSGSSSDLARFMATLVAEDVYTKVDMVAFSFSPTSGYLTSFETQTK